MIGDGTGSDHRGRVQRGRRAPAAADPGCAGRGRAARERPRAQLGLAQPQVSKHLRVLREVGAVDVRDEGRQRLYRLNGRALKPIHDWVKSYEQLWTERFDALDACSRNSRKEEGRWR